MSTKQIHTLVFLKIAPNIFEQFTGIKVPSSELLKLDYADKDIAIIGTDQFTVSQLR